ncbi:MAG: MASE3 domain-containing protein [bacterium]|nr:MASE3 domain-containing protein [bacterium]
MDKQKSYDNLLPAVQLGVILFLLYLAYGYNYPFFHTLAELFTVIIAGGVFAIVWNARKFSDNNYFLFIGVSLLFVGLVDLFHLMAYKGINVYSFGGDNLPTQLWIAARLMESASLVIAPFFINKKLHAGRLFFFYFVFTSVLLSTIFIFKIFPESYAEGAGLTPFKIYAEYLVMALFAAGAARLYQIRKAFSSRVMALIGLAFAFKILSEMMFTLYTDVFSSSNFLGHMFKAGAYYLIYLGIIEASLKQPYKTLFKTLKDSETSLKESEQRYRSLVEYSPNATFLHAHGIINYINAAGVKLFGATKPEQLIGKKVLDLIDHRYKYLINSRISSLNQGVKFVKPVEIKILTLNNELVDVETTGSLVNLRGKIAIQSIMTDITQRKKADLAKTEFVSLASHQLRTPLANIGLSTELLLRGIAGPLDQKQEKYLKEIYKSTQRMKGLIGALLNISRIELGTFVIKLERFRLTEVIEEIINEKQTKLKIKKLSFKKHYQAGLPLVKFDKNILGIVVDNLISNAIRYTPENGEIKLAAEKSGNSILISVTDTGYGIPEEQQNKIFEKLFRADNAKEIATDGAGLGLYTAKSVLSKVGGKIWFKSKNGAGTTFFVTIPIEQ